MHGGAADAGPGDRWRVVQAEASADDGAGRSVGPAVGPAGTLLRCAGAEPALGGGYYICDDIFRVGVYGIRDGFVRAPYCRLAGGDHLRSDLALDALEMAIWARRHEDIGGLVHHSDCGVQYTAIRYTERLGEAKAVRSVGSKGDSYDNAAAESLNSLYKRELIDFKKGWQGVDDVTLATMDWVSWHNGDRLHSYCGDMPPKEYEEIYYKAPESGKVRGSSQT